MVGMWTAVVMFWLIVITNASSPEKKVDMKQQLVDQVGMKQQLVDLINQDKSSTWKAVLHPRFHNFTSVDFKRLAGVVPRHTVGPHMNYSAISTVPILETNIARSRASMKLPRSFDARKEWPRCTSVGEILDQGLCGSCWAFGAVEAFTDRFCIHSRSKHNPRFSVNQVVTCCGRACGLGCIGGWSYPAWQYIVDEGLVTRECNPYTVCSDPKIRDLRTPKCNNRCKNKAQWSRVKRYGANAYHIPVNEEAMKREIFVNGPIEVDFRVFEDFFFYKSGVYQHMYGGFMGGHAVKVIGWGTQNGIPYWTIVNSWGLSWGDKGLFKFLRGMNHCGIESRPVAGLPRLNLGTKHRNSTRT